MFKRPFCWAYFRGSLFSEGLLIGGNFAFQNGLDLTIQTANINSPWAYIREDLLSEGYLRLRFAGLIFGRAFFGGVGGRLLSEFYGASLLSEFEVYKHINVFLQNFREEMAAKRRERGKGPPKKGAYGIH